jgi:hypothetical protein
MAKPALRTKSIGFKVESGSGTTLGSLERANT